ncbi:FAD-binding oxidoreductase [Panacagrimonas sp.]|uniref:FAD-binding oxidoreductase n=1 Tax=Panacagrimonas sp. TaxID=2480088 RepID=UPI003B516122
MRRWNGWGEAEQSVALGSQALAFLRERIGPGQASPEAELDAVLRHVAASRLQLAGFDVSPETRLRHARGHSYRDWLALKYGRIGPVADAVASPATHEEARGLLQQAREAGAVVIPWGGGTSVVGHLDVPVDSDRPVLNLSLQHMNRLLDCDSTTRLARFGAGVAGPQIEAQLRDLGLMLGHYPQSFEYSTLGGWVVTRSSGQQSLRYGRIEQLFAAGRLATARGDLEVGGVPASSAGPDLREFVLGSEGRLGVLTEATVRLRPLPEREDFHAVFFPTWDQGVLAVRNLVQADLPLSMLRLSNESETETQLTLSGHDKAITWLKRYLKLRGSGVKPVMLVMGVTGLNREVLRTRRESLTVCKLARGVHAGRMIGAGWAKNRFRGPYLRNALWEAGYGADTVETCVNWPQLTPLMRAIEQAATDVMAQDDERVHAFTHLSHVYRQGCSLYSTFVFRSAADYEQDLARWQRLKARLSQTVVAHGGTISHQHGVGTDHAPYLAAEKGALGMDLIRAVARELDPDRMMNPGKLFA